MALSPNQVRESTEFGDKTLTLETGRLAKQANGSVLVTHGETVVLVTACATNEPRPGMGFLPLTVDVQEKSYAAGKLPGGFFKREGRPSDPATLAARLIDRPIRPLFPEGFTHEVQIIVTVLSVDQENDANLCGLIGTSAALHISDIPWNGPIVGSVVGRHDDEWVACPNVQKMEESECEILLAARRDGIVMVEGGMNELSEDQTVEALQFGHESMAPVFDLIERLRDRAGKPKREFVPPERDHDFESRVRELAYKPVQDAAFIHEKHTRSNAIDKVVDDVVQQLGEDATDREGEVKELVGDLNSEVVRDRILSEHRRIDGRGLDDIREIECEVGVLPRTHGSALFTRGETQALASITFGMKHESQKIDALTGEYFQRFMLHYNFPPFSVGEVRFMRGPKRRDIGHGELARRAILPMIPSEEDFPYTIRVVSEVLESNGSSSMATVCSSSMALMQAGAPVKNAVAGIAMGLITDGERTAVLSDILGDEDHLGDMDFKVAGTREGITSFQMDIKVESLPWDVLRQALGQAQEGRHRILDSMNEVIAHPASDLSEYAPRIFSVLINPDKIRDLIGPGGKHIRAIQDETGVDIDIDDNGKVNVCATDGEAAAEAIERIKAYTEEPEVGKIYLGRVEKTVDFGAFVSITPGTDGLCHISELADERVPSVEDVVSVGDRILVKVIGIDRQGKIKLSRQAALQEQSADQEQRA